MPWKRKFIGLTFLGSFVLFFLISSLTGFYFYIPTYIESKIIPEIAQETGITNYFCKVRNIGFSGADLGPVRIGNETYPAISIDAVQIDYSLKDLYQRRVKRIVLSGMKLFGEYQNGEFSVRQFDLKSFLAGPLSSEKTPSDFPKDSQTISIERLIIRNAVAIFNFGKRRLRLPFDIEMIPGKTETGQLDMQNLNGIVQCYPRGQKFVIKSKIDLRKQSVTLGFDAKALHLEKFADFVRQVPGVTFYGETDINGALSFYIRPFKISSASVTCLLHRSEIIYNYLKIYNFQPAQPNRPPFKVEIRANGAKEWKISGTGTLAISPIFMQISDINGDLRFSEDTIQASGDFTVLFDKFMNESPIAVKMFEPLKVKSRYIVKSGKNGEWEFKVDNVDHDTSTNASQDHRFKLNNLNGIATPPRFHISGTWDHGKGSANYTAVLPFIQIREKFTSIKTRSVSLEGTAGFGQLLKKERSFTNFVLKMPSTDLKLKTTNIHIPGASLSGKLWEGQQRSLHYNGIFKFNNTSIAESKLNAKIRGIYGVIPLEWPLKGSGKTGRYAIKALQWEKRNLGAVNGTIQQKGLGLVFNGTHVSRLLPELTVDFAGRAGLLSSGDYAGRIHFELQGHEILSDVDLGKFVTSAKGVHFNGEVEAKGDMDFGGTGIKKSTLHFNLKNGEIQLKEKGNAIEGVQMVLDFTDLINMRSAPKQVLRFEKASLGGLKINGGKIEFQTESVGTILIEKSRVSWCDGNIYTEAMRISPAMNDVDLILFCDRLNLAMILEQLAAVHAEGTGTVNGRLPIHLNHGKIRFDDGFLFSTPGEGGKIHVTGMERLIAGIPTHSPQYIQIALAKEALKDYDYDWAKLNLMTQGENLVFRLQLTGKPARPLPFVYKKEFKGFTKIDAGSKGSIFQGINLDVHFKVPLDKILHYKDIFNMIK